MKEKLNIHRIYTKYELTQGKYKIHAKISTDKITLKNPQKQQYFEFDRSSKETIMAIAKLMLEATKLN